MKPTRVWLIVAVVAVLGITSVVAVSIARDSKTMVFPGTHVNYHVDGGPANSAECWPYPSTLNELVEITEAVVIGVVESDIPNLTQTYGTSTPIELNGELPVRRTDYISRVLTIRSERAIVGKAPEMVTVVIPGWFIGTDNEWYPILFDGQNRVSKGDRGVFPIIPATGIEANWAQYTLPCTGVFVIEQGKVRPGKPNDSFADAGYYDMSEKDLVQTISAAGR